MLGTSGCVACVCQPIQWLTVFFVFVTRIAPMHTNVPAQLGGGSISTEVLRCLGVCVVVNTVDLQHMSCLKTHDCLYRYQYCRD